MIRLVLRQRPSARLDLDGIIPERLAGLSEAEIAGLVVSLGGRRAALGDWFTATKSDENLEHRETALRTRGASASSIGP